MTEDESKENEREGQSEGERGRTEERAWEWIRSNRSGRRSAMKRSFNFNLNSSYIYTHPRTYLRSVAVFRFHRNAFARARPKNTRLPLRIVTAIEIRKETKKQRGIRWRERRGIKDCREHRD